MCDNCNQYQKCDNCNGGHLLDDHNNDYKIFDDVYKWYGGDAQIDVLIEEMSELTKALIKARRNKSKDGIDTNVLEEVVDVEICLDQLKEIFKIRSDKMFSDLYYDMRKSKVNRLKERLQISKGSDYII